MTCICQVTGICGGVLLPLSHGYQQVRSQLYNLSPKGDQSCKSATLYWLFYSSNHNLAFTGMNPPSVDNAEPVNHTGEAGYWKFMAIYPVKMIRTWC